MTENGFVATLRFPSSALNIAAVRNAYENIVFDDDYDVNGIRHTIFVCLDQHLGNFESLLIRSRIPFDKVFDAGVDGHQSIVATRYSQTGAVQVKNYNCANGCPVVTIDCVRECLEASTDSARIRNIEALLQTVCVDPLDSFVTEAEKAIV